jgi:hypothetical protein
MWVQIYLMYFIFIMARNKENKNSGKIDVINKISNVDPLHSNVNVSFFNTWHLIMLGLVS